MRSSLVQLESEIQRMFETIRRTTRVDGMPKPPYITTMTFTVLLDGCASVLQHDIQKLRACNTYFDTIEPSKFSAKAITMTKMSTNMNIKVFPKGSVHATGCRDLDDLQTLVECLCRLLHKAYDLSRIPSGTSASLNMINVGTTWPTPIRLTEFAKACWDLGGYAEQPEKPPSCIVRHDATALAYKSGKMIVTGKSPRDVASTFGFVSCILQKI